MSDKPVVLVAACALIDIDGRVLLEDGRPTLFDSREAASRAQAVAARLWGGCNLRPLSAD